VEKVGAHAAFRENLWTKAGPNQASINSSEKRIMLFFYFLSFVVLWVKSSFIGQGRT